MLEQNNYCVSTRDKGRLAEHIRRIGLAGAALAQLRVDYERRPSALVRQAIRRKIDEVHILGMALEEEEGALDLAEESNG